MLRMRYSRRDSRLSIAVAVNVRIREAGVYIVVLVWGKPCFGVAVVVQWGLWRVLLRVFWFV